MVVCNIFNNYLYLHGLSSPFSFLIVFIWVPPLFSLMSLVKGLSILLIFSKNQLLVSLILCVVLLKLYFVNFCPNLYYYSFFKKKDFIYLFIYLFIFAISFFKNFYCYSITVVCLFSPSLHPTPAEPTSLPHLHPPPWFCPCVLYSSSCRPLFPLSPPHSPLAIG